MGRKQTIPGEHGAIRVSTVVEKDDWDRILGRLDAPQEVKEWLSSHGADVVRLAKSLKDRRGTLRYVAVTDYRVSGSMRRVQAEGATEDEARAELVKRIADVQSSETGSVLTPVSKIAKLVDLLIENLNDDPKLRPQSRELYLDIIQRFIRPRLEHLQVRDFDTATLNQYFRGLRDDEKFHAAKISRVMLNRAAKVALDHRAIDRNPVPDTIRVVDLDKQQRAIDEGPQVLAPDDLHRMRLALREREKPGRNGPTPDRQLRSIFELYAALGRPGEVLALRVRDVDLDATPPTLTFAGTIVEVGGERFRQPTTKTSQLKSVALPPVLVAAVQRRLEELGPNAEPDQLLFTTRAGEPLGRRDLATRLRRVADPIGLPHVYGYLLRRTSGTAVSQDHGIAAAAHALGHAEGETRTAREHYIGRQARIVGTEITDSIERLMPSLDD